MLLYYQSWTFYIHLLATLYHFLGLTYWHSAQCQLLFFACFLYRGKSIPNGVKMPRNFLEIFSGPEEIQWAKEASGGALRGAQPTRARLGGVPWRVEPTSGAPRTASLLYKYPNIPETVGESTKHNSSRRKFQNHEIQSKHHHRGVHHPHWCLSDDAWVVHHRPTQVRR